MLRWADAQMGGCLDGQMQRWVDVGFVDAWTGGWADARVSRWTDECSGGRVNTRPGGRTLGYTGARMAEYSDGRMLGWPNAWMGRQMLRCVGWVDGCGADGQRDGWMGGGTVAWLGGCTDRPKDTCSDELVDG